MKHDHNEDYVWNGDQRVHKDVIQRRAVASITVQDKLADLDWRNDDLYFAAKQKGAKTLKRTSYVV